MSAASDPFIESLTQIRWFHATGQPLQEEGVLQLASCVDWPGPEDPRVEAFFSKQQALKDELEKLCGDHHSEMLALWDTIHRRVIETAGPVIGHNPVEDAWHGPSAATWHAAWTAGLMAWCQEVEYPIPNWLAQQWSWFIKGRWPAGFATLGKGGAGKGFLVL